MAERETEFICLQRLNGICNICDGTRAGFEQCNDLIKAVYEVPTSVERKQKEYVPCGADKCVDCDSAKGKITSWRDISNCLPKQMLL